MSRHTEKSEVALPLTPISLLRTAIQAVPAVKYALAVGGVAAVVAIVAGFNIDYRIAIFGTVIVFCLMFIMLLFARLNQFSSDFFYYPTLFVTWAFLLMIVATTFFLMSGYFFAWPKPLDSVTAYLSANQGNASSTAGPTAFSITGTPTDGATITLVVKSTSNKISLTLSTKAVAGANAASMASQLAEQILGTPALTETGVLVNVTPIAKNNATLTVKGGPADISWTASAAGGVTIKPAGT